MKLVHIAIGNTIPVKEELKKIGFMWLPVDKVWVQWLNPDDDAPNEETRQILSTYEGVVCVIHIADPFIRTCVDPIHGDRNVTASNYNWREDLSPEEKAQIKSLNKTKVKERKATDNHHWVGKKAELNKYAARSVQEEINKVRKEPITYIYRNIVIKEVQRETARAVLLKLEFFGGIGRNCHVCGAKLDTEISRACGIGPTCAKNMGLPRPTPNNASIILAQIEQIAGSIGEVGPVWVPKSCIEVLD